jgi:hypothetical protein
MEQKNATQKLDLANDRLRTLSGEKVNLQASGAKLRY